MNVVNLADVRNARREQARARQDAEILWRFRRLDKYHQGLFLRWARGGIDNAPALQELLAGLLVAPAVNHHAVREVQAMIREAEAKAPKH